MGFKRQPTPHQKQIRFFAILFTVIVILLATGLILMLNRPIGGYHFY